MRQLHCPAEVTAPLPLAPAPPVDAAIDAAEATLAWLGARFAREGLLERRIADAATECRTAAP